MTIYHGVRRLVDGWMVHWQESPFLPADGGTSLVAVAVNNYGGTLEDYEWFEMTGSNYAYLQSHLPPIGVPTRFYFNDNEITYDAMQTLNYDGEYLSGVFAGQTEVTVIVSTDKGDKLLEQVTAAPEGAYREFVQAPIGYRVVVVGLAEPRPRGEYTF